MLGSFGLWASSKGMKTLSNFVGLDRNVAKTQIVAEGLTVGSETAQQFTDAADESKNNKVVAQSPSAGTSVQYESPVDITYGIFSFTVFNVFNFTPFNVFNFTPFSVFNFTPFNVFNFFGVFNFTPFTVFNFSFFVFSFTPFAVFGFFTVFNFTPFSVFGFR